MIPIAPHIPKEQQFIATKCFVCGRANQSLFTIAQIHIDYVTMNYPKQFYQMDFIPSVDEIKNLIWKSSNKNTSIIRVAKMATNFKPSPTDNIFLRLAWFRVYQYINHFLKDTRDRPK